MLLKGMAGQLPLNQLAIGLRKFKTQLNVAIAMIRELVLKYDS